MDSDIQQIVVQFVLEESRKDALLAEVDKSGGQSQAKPFPYVVPPELIDKYGDSNFDPFLVIPVAVSLGFLIKRISDVCLDHLRPGGQVIDLRDHPPIARFAPYLKRGSLVVITLQGERVYAPEEKDQALDSLEKMFSGLASKLRKATSG